MASRTGSARVFFEIVGSFQAMKLLNDAEAAMVVMRAILLDAFGGIAEAIQFTFEGISDVIQEQVDAYYKYEEQMIQIRKFYQGDEKEILSFAASARELGETFAFSGAEALKAGANMAQMKTVLQSQEAVIAGTELGLLFAEIGNMESQEGMKKLTSLMQQTGFAMGGLTREQYRNLEGWEQAEVVYSNTMRVLDQMNTIENSSVATMQEMTFVLNQFASQANLAGESMGSMSAMAALLVEAGEETSRAGTGLKMMFSRLAVDGGEASTAIADIVPHLDAEAVSMMSLTDVITELVPYYNELSSIEKIRLTQAMAGNRHYVKLQKLLENHERLIELNAMAYTGQYGAADEFMNRQKSMVFQIDRANATIENQRVEVGENLVEAYKRALAPQYQFLVMMEKMTTEGYKMNVGFAKIPMNIKPVISNIMFMAETMKQLEVPINFVMGLMNIYISYATFYTIMKQTMKMQELQQERWKQEMFVKQQVKILDKSMTTQRLDSISEIYAAESKAFFVDLQHMQIRAAGQAKIIAGEKKKEQEMWAQYQRLGQMDTTKKMQQGMELQALRQIAADKIVHHELEKSYFEERHRMHMLESTEKEEMRRNQLTYWELGDSHRLKAQQAQLVHVANIKKNITSLASEIVVLKALTDAEKDHLATRLGGLWVKVREEQMHLAEMQRRLQLATLTDEEIIDLEALILLQKEEILTLANLITGIEGLVFANKQLEQRTKDLTRENVSWTNSIVRVDGSIQYLNTTLQFTKDYYRSFVTDMKSANAVWATSMRKVTSSAAGLLGLFALISEDGDEMMANIIGIAIATGTLNIALWYNKRAIDGVTLSVIALEAATGIGLVLAVAGFALMIGRAIWDVIRPDDSFEDTLSAIADLNENVSAFHSNMTELSRLSGVIDDALLGGTTWNQLRGSAEMSASAVGSILNEIIRLEGMRDAPGLERATVISLQGRIDYYDQLITKVQTLDTAHKQLAGTMTFAYPTQEYGAVMEFSRWGPNWSEEQELMYQIKVANGWEMGMEMLKAQRFEAMDMWTVMYDNMTYYYKTEEDAIEHMRDIELEQQHDRLTWISEYAREMGLSYKTVLDMVDQEGAAISDSMGTALDELNEFANAREELFFGSQANFQGAIYKQITQGGIESVLHRVEIIQTNVFNGVTIDEAIDKVTQGVVTNLRAQGVPI